MRKLLLATTLVGLPFLPAHAVQILNDGQTSGSNTVIATENASMTATTISIVDAVVSIAQIDATPVILTPLNAFVDLTATSIDAATGVGASGLLQHYSGTFSITSGAGGTGINYLSGSFTDAAFGLATGDQLSVNIANPPDTLVMSSAVGLPTAAPSSLTFALSNLVSSAPFTGGLQADTRGATATIAPFTASFTDTADANAVATPEPGSILLLTSGLLGMGVLGFLRRT